METIRRWWRERPDGNVGFATGAGSGVWVLDVDGLVAQAVLDELQRVHGRLPETVAAKTARGTHLYWRYPDDRRVGNSKGRLPANIDVRGEGGFVVGPPSLHATGVRYEWLRAPSATPFADAPDWLLDLISAPGQPPAAVPAGAVVADAGAFDATLDLRSHPGVAEGGRHNTAIRMVGSHLGRGENPIDVLDLVYDWNRRNAPPENEDSLKRIVRDLSAKDLRKAEALVATWPVMGEAAFRGWAGEAVRLIEPQSEADSNAMLLQALVIAGHSFGPAPHFVIENSRHGTNLFAVVVGDTADGRKGTGFDRVAGLLPELHGSLLTGLATGEGLIYQVRDPSRPTVRLRRGSRKKRPDSAPDDTAGDVPAEFESSVVEDMGVADKRLLVRESEFKNVFAQGKRDGNILNNVMRCAWDGGKLGVMTKSSPLEANVTHISVIGNMTREELLASMSTVDASNGFANRILWAMSRRSKDLPLGGARVDLSGLKWRLTERMEFAQGVGEMQIADDARALYDAEYRTKLNRSRGGKVVAKVTNRGAATVVRLAMIYALLDGSAVIHLTHIESALTMWEYCHQSAAYIFGQGGGLREDVLAAIRERDCCKTDLYRLGNNRVSGYTLNTVLGELERDGLIRRETRGGTGGRPVEWLVAVGGD